MYHIGSGVRDSELLNRNYDILNRKDVGLPPLGPTTSCCDIRQTMVEPRSDQTTKTEISKYCAPAQLNELKTGMEAPKNAIPQPGPFPGLLSLQV